MPPAHGSSQLGVRRLTPLNVFRLSTLPRRSVTCGLLRRDFNIQPRPKSTVALASRLHNKLTPLGELHMPTPILPVI